MNGRVYDPTLARFMSADILVPEPNNTQSYNRYAYVHNRPLFSTDPTGFENNDNDDQCGNESCSDSNSKSDGGELVAFTGTDGKTHTATVAAIEAALASSNGDVVGVQVSNSETGGSASENNFGSSGFDEEVVVNGSSAGANNLGDYVGYAGDMLSISAEAMWEFSGFGSIFNGVVGTYIGTKSGRLNYGAAATQLVKTGSDFFLKKIRTLQALAKQGYARARDSLRVAKGGSVGAMKRLEFDPAPYHKKVKSGRKNPGPTDGQHALDISIQVNNNSARRIAVDKGNKEFVLFDETGKGSGVFHGHTRSWKELNSEQRAISRKHFGVDKKGNF